METFRVDLSLIPKNRRLGVSGMMRVKNDAEFIEQSVKSCIDALDELVIVYNDCSDNSPEIINCLQKLYPSKIKVYEYKPFIYAWNLSSQQVHDIFSNSIPIENTLAGYYNFALSKTTCRYVMKIDADQIYIGSILNELCECYRASKVIKPSLINDKISLFSLRILLSLSVRCNISISLLNQKRIYRKYYTKLLKYIAFNKPDVSLSGINIVYSKNSDIYIPIETKIISESEDLNLPYNGEGDHPLFLVTDKTYFLPKLDKQYNLTNKIGTSIIEQLYGLRKPWRLGVYWVHLNRCRRKNYTSNLKLLANNPSRFILFDKFVKSKLSIFASFYCNNTLLQKRMREFEFVHASITPDIIKIINDKIKFIASCQNAGN